MKEGFSVADVAALFHCCPHTIRSWVESGKLGAHVDPPVITPGRHRQIRFTRQHIKEYMKAHPSKFDKTLMEKFGVFDEPDTKVEPAETRDDISSHEADGVPASVLAHNPELMETVLRNFGGGQVPAVEEKRDIPKLEDKDRCRIRGDGYLMVANITKASAASIVSILMQDPKIDIHKIEIEIG